MRLIFRVLIICFSLTLYGLFGIMGGIAYMALQDAPILQDKPTTSPILVNFLDSTETQKDFELSELQAGVIRIMMDSAAKKTKAGDAIVLPALPSLEEHPNGICVIFPIFLDSIFGKIQANIRCYFSTEGSLVFEKLQIGDAKLPFYLSKFIAASIYKSYAEFIDKYELKLLSAKINKVQGRYRISK